MRPPMKWQGVTAQATKLILQLTFMLTTVAISMEETHCRITDIRSAMITLTMAVSLIMREVNEPAVFSDLSNQPTSLRSTPIKEREITWIYGNWDRGYLIPVYRTRLKFAMAFSPTSPKKKCWKVWLNNESNPIAVKMAE